MNLNVLKIDGSSAGSIELPDEVFGIEPNVAVMHQAVKMYLANQRQGTHKTKTRAEVRGGGRKPWKQKGRGTARAGSTRTGVWVGGGNIHGPIPRDYSQAMPKKMRQLARRSALSLKAQSNELVVVEDLGFGEIKTKPFAQMLKAINASGRKAVVLVGSPNENVLRSARNIARCQVLQATDASTYDLLNNQVLVLERSSVAALMSQLGNNGAARATEEGQA
ncbi:MAG: 50S ribosomal protein L4 [Chlorobi bacterium]|nr:MAG: 50S ribosomal protein L4 [Chlorobi bacterium OLB7]MBK8911473.1 50S ribosomal protein L4 [Chlorobiota bacterium]MBX7215826.1 50S ribosomal protein L4 [Candidatus Kapabacteria bacterium]MCE7935767.1 50S ribosomal protein L4 [Chlorobi bacterium CHB2]